jgi:hypothetical protein
MPFKPAPTTTQPPKAPSFGGGLPGTNAPALNKGGLLSGLNQAAGAQPNTGTATGDQAARDYAKGLRDQGRANLGRSIDKQNSEFSMQQMKANEGLYSKQRENQLAGYRQSVQQATNNADLANQLAMWRNDMSTNWQQIVAGLLR